LEKKIKNEKKTKYSDEEKKVEDEIKNFQKLSEDEFIYLKNQQIFNLIKFNNNNSTTLKIGINEVTKSLNRDQCSFVILALDTEPFEIFMHIPLLCKEKNIKCLFVNSKKELGKELGKNFEVVACSILFSEKEDLQNFNSNIEQPQEKILKDF
jgi:ribosomal protein L7Ae-like RNA K-turn-binding protein